MRYVLPWSGDRPLPYLCLEQACCWAVCSPSCLPVWLIALAVIAAGLFPAVLKEGKA